MPRNHPCRLDPGGCLQVEITLMGGFEVMVGGVLTAPRGWARRSAASLVKLLALTPGHSLHRERVMDVLWPDEPPESAAPRLHKAAHFARKAAGRNDAVVLRDDVVSLFPDAVVTVDALRFEDLARSAVADGDAAGARQALAWFGGELLPGDRYEDWAADRRELLDLRRLDVLHVAGEWRELAELDPTNEEAQVQLMRRHLAAGDPAAALRQHDHLERVLDRDLGVSPGEAASSVLVEARRWDGAQTPSGAPERVGALAADLTDLSSGTPERVGALVAELTDLVGHVNAVLAELAAAGVVPPALEAAGADR